MKAYIELMKKISTECKNGKRAFNKHSVYIGDIYKQLTSLQIAEKIVEFTPAGVPIAKQQKIADLNVEVFHNGGWFVRTMVGKLQVVNFITKNN
jgi:hypothetical protein